MTEALHYGAMFYIQKGGIGYPRSRFTELECKIREAYRQNEAGNMLHETRHSVRQHAMGEGIERVQRFHRSIPNVSILSEQGGIMPVDRPEAGYLPPRLGETRGELP